MKIIIYENSKMHKHNINLLTAPVLRTFSKTLRFNLEFWFTVPQNVQV